MSNKFSWNKASSIARSLRSIDSCETWHLRCKPVCASTEIDLTKWLKETSGFNGYPRAVLAARQRFGKGQYGRLWYSPPGGIWLSAAIPFDVSINLSGLFGLAVAVSVSKMLQEKSVPVRLKWPNDLIVYQRKLAGLLPKIVSRGESIKYARVGIGLNLRNRVPERAISLAEILNQRNLSISEWSAKILVSLEKVNYLIRHKEFLCKEAEELLLTSQDYKDEEGKIWEIDGINFDGSLRLIKNGNSKFLYHWG